MLRTKLMKEVAVPIWYGLSNLVKLSVSEEALLIYVSIIIDTVLFVVECVDELALTTRWALGSLVDLNEPEVFEKYTDENLYLMPSHDSWNIMSSDVEEVLNYWISKAYDRFSDEEMSAEYWETPLLCGSNPKILPEFRKRVGVRRLA